MNDDVKRQVRMAFDTTDAVTKNIALRTAHDEITRLRAEREKDREALRAIRDGHYPACPFDKKESGVGEDEPCPICGDMNEAEPEEIKCFAFGASNIARARLADTERRETEGEEMEQLDDICGHGLWRRKEVHGGYSYWTDDIGGGRRVFDEGLDDWNMLFELARRLDREVKR